ncbi:MAG: integrin alpha [Verrucomicrobiota bacterium]|nr:integrin alpha [Verrucomicrobiota bacterium]
MKSLPTSAFFALVLSLASALCPSSIQAQSAQLIRTHSSPAERDFGNDIAKIGDLDGDGRPDYAIGAPDLGTFGLDGAVYTYSGTTGVLLRTFRPPVANREALFGASVAGVGDLSGDGVPDLLIGEPDLDGATGEKGMAYLYDGATAAVLRTFNPPSTATSGDFGAEVADAGDVSGDGVSDFLIGATDAKGFVGQAFLYNGATGALLKTFDSPTPRNGGNFGRALAGVEDANGDGVRDVLVGAPNEGNTSFAGFGNVHLFSGASGALIRTIKSPMPSDTGRFGQSIDATADFTGDGRRDALIGEPNGGPNQPGKVYLYDIAANTFPVTFNPPPDTSGEVVGTFGESVAAMADLTGDGVPEVVIGDPGFTDTNFAPPLTSGRVHVSNGATGVELFHFRSPQEQGFGEFGAAVADIGDIDADGDTDFAVGAPGEVNGRVYVYAAIPGGVVMPAVTVAIQPLAPPVVIPPAGGSFQFTATFNNSTSSSQTFDFWTVISGPLNRDPALRPRAITLSPGGSLTRTYRQRIPRSYPSGSYNYTGNVGTFGGTVTDSDSFTFEKQAATTR